MRQSAAATVVSFAGGMRVRTPKVSVMISERVRQTVPVSRSTGMTNQSLP